MKTNLPHLQPVGKSSLPATFRKNYSFKTVYHRVWMFMLLGLLGIATFAQNAIVGSGFAPGWGGACGSNADFQYFAPGAGGSWKRSSFANGTNNQFFRLAVDWDGQFRQHTITIGSDVKVEPGTEYTLNGTCTTSGAMFIDVASTDHTYIFKTANAGTNPQYRFVYFRLEGAEKSIAAVSQATDIKAGQPSTITATLEDEIVPGMGVYLRYTTDAFATSTVLPMTGADTEFTANIPGFAQGTEVTYYCFTSGSGLAAQLNHSNADFFTINLNGNEGLNYRYTVLGADGYKTIANGDWTNPATWEGGAIPNSEEADAIIDHNVTVNENVAIRSLKLKGGVMMTIPENRTLTIGNNGLIDNSNGALFMGTGLLRFAGAGGFAGPTQLYSVQLNGAVDLKGSFIQHQLEIRPNGAVADKMPVYGVGSTLVMNVNGAYNSFFEWTPQEPVHHVRLVAGTSYTLCNSSPTAAFKANGDIVVETDAAFFADPLCNGNEGAEALPQTNVDFLTIGRHLAINPNGQFVVRNGDVGDLNNGAKFNIRVKGDVINNAGFLTLNNHIGDDLYVEGNWVNDGVFNPGNNGSAGDNPVTVSDGRAVLMVGTQLQTIGGSTVTEFHYLIIDNAAGAVLAQKVEVSRALILQSGKVNMQGNSIMLGTLFAAEGGPYILGRLVGGGSNAYLYGGELFRAVSNIPQPTDDGEQVAPNAGQTYLFPMGTADAYRPFSITYTKLPSQFGMVGVMHEGGPGVVTGAQPNLTDADGVAISNYYTNALWNLNTAEIPELNDEILPEGIFTVSYTCNGCEVGKSNLQQIRAIRRMNGESPWMLPNSELSSLVPTTGTPAEPTVGRTGVTGYQQYAIGLSDLALPVSLTSFVGTRTATGNLLSWVSSSEENFSHYELQRSTDSRNWMQIARINGTGGNFIRTYSHLDQKATGLNYYRLNMVDRDGSSKFSHIVILKGNEPVSGGLTAAYHPGMQHVILQNNGGAFDAGTQARVIDINGRVLTQQIIGSTNIHHLKTGRLASGIYMVQVQQGKEQEVIKVWVH
jgi:hypothetical protein